MNKKLLRKKLALMLATLKKKRKYYVELEYLESTGTQYIDTGYKMSAGKTMTFNGNIMYTQSNENANFFYGYRSVDSAEYRGDMRAFFVYGTSAPPAGRLAIRYGVNTDNSSSTISFNQRYNISFDGTNLKVDGTYFISVSSYYTPAVYQNMYLFWCNCTGYYSADVAKFSGRIYNWQIFEDGVLVRDFIPVLDWDMTPCMYDKVTEQLFYNAGTGSFVAGRQVHPVEYLESTGTQYINTGIKNKSTLRIEAKFNQQQIESRYAWVFSGRDESVRGGGFGFGYNSESVYISDYFGDRQISTITAVLNTDVVVDKNKNVCKITTNNTTTTLTNVNSASSGDYSITLFALNNAGTVADFSTLRLFYAKIWDNGVLVRDYIPAIDSSGTPFMFDRVSHTCYLNQGTGSFKYPAREVEYLQSSGTQYIDTGIKIDDTCGYDISWMALNSDDRIIFGTKGSDDSRWVLSGNNNPFLNMSWNSVFTTDCLGLNKIQTAKMNYLNDRKRILNDTPLEDISTTLSSSASTYNVGIFAGYWGSSTVSLYSTCRIYYAKITKGTETIRDFIPCYKDSALGMWDKVNNVFYPNAGTGSFSVGRIVEPEYE